MSPDFDISIDYHLVRTYIRCPRALIYRYRDIRDGAPIHARSFFVKTAIKAAMGASLGGSPQRLSRLASGHLSRLLRQHASHEWRGAHRDRIMRDVRTALRGFKRFRTRNALPVAQDASGDPLTERLFLAGGMSARGEIMLRGPDDGLIAGIFEFSPKPVAQEDITRNLKLSILQMVLEDQGYRVTGNAILACSYPGKRPPPWWLATGPAKTPRQIHDARALVGETRAALLHGDPPARIVGFGKERPCRHCAFSQVCAADMGIDPDGSAQTGTTRSRSRKGNP